MRNRSAAIWRVLLLLYTAVLTWALITPGWHTHPASRISRSYFERIVFWSDSSSRSDIVLNVAVFAVLGFLVVQGGLSRAVTPRVVVALAILTGTGLSITVELLQQYLPTRVASGLDILMNFLGVTAGAIITVPLRNRVDRWTWTLIDAPGGMGRRVAGYVLILVLLSLWPFRMRTSPHEIAQGLRAIHWDLLEPPHHGWVYGGMMWARDVLLFVPLGYLAADRRASRKTQGSSRQRWRRVVAVGRVVALGLVVGGGLEAAQVMVQGRRASTQQIGMAVVGVLAGVWLRVRRERVDEQERGTVFPDEE